MDAARTLPAQPQTDFLGHPPGLAVLAFTEAWERFSFYGMQSLLTLYMLDQLLRPNHAGHVPGLALLRGAITTVSGPQSAAGVASEIFGLYTASVYVTPVLGSLLADRWLGRTRAISLGAILMAFGHFAMAFEAGFIPALLLLIAGCGLLKGNIAAQVGGLYPGHDPRRTDAFQIFVLAISVGVIAAPLACGTLAALYGYPWGFGAAGIGMLVALATYLSCRHLLPDPPRPAHAATPPLTRRDWHALAAQATLIPLLAVCFVCNNQVYNIYLVWARDSANLTFFGHTMPVTWLVSYDAIVSALLLPAAVLAWRWLGARGIDAHELTKLTGAALFAICGSLTLAAASALAHGGKVPLAALLLFHIVNGLAFVHLLPVGLALFSRTAPVSLNATMVGLFYTLFVGTNLLVGRVGALYGTVSNTTFWLIHAALIAAAACTIAALYRPLRRALA
jgi:proton-dependent oligopeptide transporter, POT family